MFANRDRGARPRCGRLLRVLRTLTGGPRQPPRAARATHASQRSLPRLLVGRATRGVSLPRVQPVTRHPTSADASAVGQPSGRFGPEWLRAQLSTLLPAFPDVSLCVALSGGLDSTALLAALAKKQRGTRYPASHGPASRHPTSLRLRALHVDHGLRPASRQWAAHCRALARELRVPLKVLTTKVERARGGSLEAAAREARYRLLASALHPGEVLLTAHHSDDQLETVLLQLLRGSGLPGLSAMPAVAPFARGLLARPLLSRSRGELESWVREQGLTWVEDDSNVDEGFDRNYLRLRVLPLIRDRWPGSATAVARSARHAAEAQSLLDTLARADTDRASYGESLSIKSLRTLPPDRLRNALRFWITRSGYLAPGTKRLEEITGPLLGARPDANPFVEWGEGQGSARVQRHGDLLSLGRKMSRETSRPPQSPGASHTPAVSTPTGAAHAPSAAKPVRAAHTPSAAAPPTGAAHAPSAAKSVRAAHTPSAAPPTRAARTPTDSTPTVSPRTRASSTSPTPPIDLLWSWRDSHVYNLPHDLGKLELQPDARGPVDLDTLPHPLTIRWRRGGERLSPRRGGPRRALKNLLQESHVPVSERPRLPLLFSAAPAAPVGAATSSAMSSAATPSGATPSAERLLAVADLLLDETVQATPSSRRRARLRWKKSSHRSD
jgi:tRNA(Ile)-lysidine synthase